jgi:uncharacterized protein YdaU (DUF1376 family)
MPMFWKDYFADTRHLTVAEHGAYLLLIGHYWINGGLPSDDDTIRRLALVRLKDWPRIRRSIAPFFGNPSQGSLWGHKRVTLELGYAIEKSRRLSANAKLRHSIGTASAYTPTPTPTKKEVEGPHKKRNSRKQANRIPMPETWQPDESGLQYASDNGLSQQIPRMIKRCRDYHIKNGTLIAGDRGLAATWRTWCDNEVRFSADKNGAAVDPDFVPYSVATKGMTEEQKKQYVQDEMRKFREANRVG